eukprot:g32056.t1
MQGTPVKDVGCLPEEWLSKLSQGELGIEDLREIDPDLQNSSELEELYTMLELQKVADKIKFRKYIRALRQPAPATPTVASSVESSSSAPPAFISTANAPITATPMRESSRPISSHSESAFPRGGRQELDLARILELSNESKKAVEVSGECDAIILLGITGCGKTTATHYLGGGTMILYSPDGITRKRVECKEEFEGAQIGFGAASVTRYVKAFRAIPEYGNVWVVDPPGILDSAGPEVDIANAVGTQYAFRLVKSARPVLLLNINELTVARARSMVQVIKVLNDWFHPIQDYYPDYLTIFFTHLTEDDKAQAVRNMLGVLKDVAKTLNYKTLSISEEEAADLKYLIEKLLEVAERVKEDCILFPYPPTQPAHYLKLLLQKEPIPRNKLVQTIPISQENKTALSNQCGNLLFESQDHLDNDEFQELEKKLDVLRGLMEGTGLPLLEDKYKEITGKVEAAFDNQLKSLRSSLAKQNYQVAKHLLALKAMGCLSKHVTGDRRGAFENAKKDLEEHMLELGEAAKDGKQPVATVAGSLDCMRQVHQHLQDFLRKGVAEDYYNSLRCLLERLQVRFETAKRVIGTLEAQDFAVAEEGLTNQPFPAGFKSPEAMVHLGSKPAFPEGQTVDVLEAALADLKQLAVMEAHRAATIQHPTTQVSFAKAMGWYEQCTDRLCKLLEACARRVLDKKLAARLEKEPAARLVHDVFILSQLYQNANMEVHVEAQIMQLNLALHDLGETGSQQLVQLRQRFFGVGGQQSMTAQQGPETSDDADHKDFQVDEFAGLGGSLRAVAVICCCSFEHVQKVRSECSELLVDMDAALRRVAQEAQQRWDRVSYPTLQDHEFLARCLSQLMSADKELGPLRLPADVSGDPHLRTELPADYTHFAKELRRRCREDIQVVVREILQWLGLVHYFHASTVLSRLLHRQPAFKLVLHKPHASKAVQAEITSLWKAWEDQINRLQRVWENKAHVKKAVIAYLHEDAAACLEEDGEASPGVAVSSVGKPYAGELNGKAGEPQEEASKQETDRREILMRVQREMDAKAAVLASASHGEALFYIYVTQRQYFGIVQGGLSKLSESLNKPVDELRAQLHRSREGLTQHIKDFLGKAEQDLSAKLAGCDFAAVKDGMEELTSFFLFERYETEFAAPAKKATQNLQQQLEKQLEQLLNTAVRHLNVPNYPACEAIIEQLEGAKPLDAAFGKGGLAKQLEKLKVDHAARKNNLDQHMNEYLNCNQYSKILAIVKPFKDAADQTLFLKYNAIVCTYLRDRINLDKLSPPRFFSSRQEDENQDDQLLHSAFNILTMCQSAMVLNDVLEGLQLAAELANIAKRIDDRFRAREAKLSKFMGMFEYTKAVHVFGQLERFKKFDDVWHELWPQPTGNSQPVPVSAAAADRAVPSRQDRPVHPGDIKRGAQKEDMRRNEKKGTNKAQATPAYDAKAVSVHERTNTSGRHFTDWLAKIDRKHFRQLRDKTIPLIQRLLGPSLSEGKRQEGEGEPGEPSLGVAAGAVDNLNLSSDLSFVDTILKNSQEAQIELAHNEVDLSGSEFVDLHGAVEGLLKMEWQKCQAAVKKAVGDSDISTALRQIAVARSLMTCKLLSSLHNKRFTELEENVFTLVNQPEELTAENVAKVCERLHRLRYDGNLRAFLQEQKTIEDYFGSLARTVRDYLKSATWTNTAQQKTAKALALFDAYVLRLQEGNLKELSKKLEAEVRELRQDLLEAVKEQLDKVEKARECKDWPTSLAAMQYLDQVFKSPARLVGEGSEGAKLKQKYEELTNTLAEQEDGLKKAARFLKGLDFLRAGVDAKQFWSCLDTIQSEAGVLRVGGSQLSYAKCEEELQLRLNQAVEEAKGGLRTGRNTKLSPRQMVEADDAAVEEEKLHVYSALQILLRNLEELFTRTLARESRHPIVVNAAKQARDQLVRPIREKLDKSGQEALQLCKQKNFKALEPIWEDLRQLETAIKEFSALFGDMPVDSLIKHITADVDQQFQAFYAQQNDGLNELASFIVNVIKNTHEISQKEVQAHTDEQVRNCLKRYHSKVNFFELAEILSMDEVGEELVSSGSYPEFQAAVIKKTNDLMAKSGITSEDAVHRLQNKNPDVDAKTWERLKAVHGKYEAKYQELVQKHLKDSKNEVKLDQLTWKVKQLAHKATTNDEDFPILLANMNALWTVSSSAGAWQLKQDEAMIKAPNVIQALTLLRLVGADQPRESTLANWGKSVVGFITGSWTSKVASHLAEVETGGGKSIVLGLLATFLALLGCQVDVGCYSKRLIERDEADFDEFWKLVGVRAQIGYWTLKELSSHVINERGDVRELTKAFLTGKERKLEENASPERPRILLIDEVDVFMQKDFYGACYEQGTLIKSPEISNLFKYVWSNRQAPPKLEDMKHTQAYQDVLRAMPRLEKVLDLAVASMLRDVQHFSTPQYQFKTDEGGRVVLGYRDHGDISTTKQYGFKKCFAYLYEADQKNGRIKASTAEEHLGLTIPCGSFSYAAVPKATFACTLGVTGTLSTMEDFEREVLKSEFKILLSTLTPSIYPNDKFKFDEQRDVVCLHDRTHFFEMLALDANKRREAARPVLIFFHSDKALEDFMDSEYGKRIPEIRSLREDTYNFPHALRCAVKPGQVTCLPAILGRGIDFKCNSREVEDAGGDLKALELTALQIQQAGNQLYATLATARTAYVQKLAEKRKLQVQQAEQMDLESRAYQMELQKPARIRNEGKLYGFLRTAHSATTRRDLAGSFHWIFAIDISYSMSGRLATKNTKFRRDRLGAVCEQAWDFLMGRPGPDQYYSLVVFDDRAEIMFQGQNARQDLEQVFLGLRPRGGTNFEQPFHKVIELMEAPEIKQLAPRLDGTKILFLSDGAAPTPGAVVEELMRSYPGIRIWTVKFGNDGGNEGREGLQEIAHRGKGEYRESLNGGELGEVLESFASEPMEVY